MSTVPRESTRRLAHAISLAQRDQLSAAARETARAQLEAPNSLVVELCSALLLLVCRRYHEALASLDRAVDHGGGVKALQWKTSWAIRLGWEPEARAALEAALTLQPGEARHCAALLSLHARRRDFRTALAHGDALLAVEPRAHKALVEMAAAYTVMGKYDQAKPRLERALRLSNAPELRLEAARLYRSMGAFEEARTLLGGLTADSNHGGMACIMLCELLLWGGENAKAEEEAHALLSRRQTPAIEAAAERILGMVALLKGRPDEARTRVERALSLDATNSEAHALLAQLLTDAGDQKGAHHQVSEAIANAGGSMFVAHLLRFRSNLKGKAGDPTPGRAHFDHWLPAIEALCPGATPKLLSEDRQAWLDILERCLNLMHGNRSTVPTWLSPEGLRLVPAGPEPRVESRRVLERLYVANPEELLGDLKNLARQFPYSGLPDAHRGELLLWLGRVQEARAALERALSVLVGTRWAYIGLSMCDILEGRYEEALAISAKGVRVMNNTEGPAVLVHRGEALRKLGRLDEAAVDLEKSVQMHPMRAGAWVNLGLLYLAHGSQSRARTCMEKIVHLAPGLVSDAARAEGVAFFLGANTLAENAFAPVFSRMLVLLSGNRASSCTSYLSPEGRLRFGVRGTEGQISLHSPKEDAERLGHVETLLKQTLGVSASSVQVQVPAATDEHQSLSAEQIEQFASQGYLVLKQALPLNLVDTWVREAKERMVRDPARNIKGYVGPGEPFFDLDKGIGPASGRLDVLGRQNVRISAAAPRLWQAICDLMGGASRVQTETMSDYFILKFPENEPEARPQDFHVDDPSRSMTLGGLKVGLVALCLFSDVAEDGGATQLVPGSIQEIARLLAQSPEGIDLVDTKPATVIANKLKERVFCHGKAGDVILMHGCMVHAGSSNRSHCIRWLGNPVFYLRAPMNPWAPAGKRSPVEEAIARALCFLVTDTHSSA